MSIKQMCEQMQPDIVSWRRHLHKRPEIGLEVPETAEFISDTLRSLGLSVKMGVGGHGVIGLLRGAKPGRVFAIRADVDALPVTEETGLPFQSEIPGRMHACGHDGHVAMALGAASALAQISSSLSGTVKFIFQPGEEGPGGALPMIQDGALDDPAVDAIIACHLGSIWDLSSGQVGVRPGAMMAATDRFSLTVKGRGGHGAMPHQSVDPIVIGSHCVTALQTIVSREVSPLDPAVVTVGTFHSGTVFNVIPDSAQLSGTIRYFSPAVKPLIKERIHAVLGSVVTGMRGSYEFHYHEGYPPLSNDPGFTAFFRGVASDLLGQGAVRDLPEPTMGGEDMAYFLARVPGTFFALGSQQPVDGVVYPHHHPKFTLDESVLWMGSALLAETCFRYLKSNPV